MKEASRGMNISTVDTREVRVRNILCTEVVSGDESLGELTMCEN